MRRWWRSSLPVRVVLMTLVASLLVSVLGGMLLMYQVTTGLYAAKRKAVVAEANTAVLQIRALLEGVNTTPNSSDQRLIQVTKSVYERAKFSGQYEVYLDTVAGLTKPGQLLEGDPIPTQLRHGMNSTGQLYVMPGQVNYIDGPKAVPAIFVGANLAMESGEPAPIYFVFPLREELATLDVLRSAVITVGLLLLAALCMVSYFVARTVAEPVRRAALMARRIAGGHFDERMPVVGTDEFATLNRSMNHMARELEKQIQNYEELARMQQRFVSDVSHELRTPLTTVRMAAEVLYESRADFDAASSRSTELMQSELEKFDRLLADLLEISRFDAGAVQLTLDKHSLTALVAEEVANVAALAAAHECEIVQTSTGLAEAWMDDRRIRRIVRNLLTNAIEHGEHQPIEIEVAGNAKVVALTVRDRGVGFEEHQAELVFHRFWRADPSRARTVGGTGLGLAISQEDALLHGGMLQAWGRPGAGAKFRLTLPRHSDIVVTDSILPLAPRSSA